MGRKKDKRFDRPTVAFLLRFAGWVGCGRDGEINHGG